MKSLFSPGSVVVVGASNSDFNLGATICRLLKHLNYRGDIYAVNRSGEDVHGCTGYSSVMSIPFQVELAIVMTSSKSIPPIAKECGERGIRYMIIESSGFSEEGNPGEIHQKQLDAITKSYGIRYIGPNCLGVLDTHSRFCSFFGIRPGVFDGLFDNPGSVSYITQSGGVGTLILRSSLSDVVNVSKMVSIGNKADIDESDVLEMLIADENTEVIGLYLENIGDGRKFLSTAGRSGKPVLAYKSGKTDQGARAATSHTAGMTNNDVIFDNACRQAGIITLKSVTELYSLPKIFTTMPILKGRNIVVFTNSGAFGTIMTDILVKSGFNPVRLSEETQKSLEKTGKLYNAANPIDIGPGNSKQMIIDIYKILMESDQIDGFALATNVWQQAVIDSTLCLMDMCRHYQKPAAIYLPNAVERILEVRKEYGIPSFESPEEAVRALEVSFQYHRYSIRRR